MPQSQPVELSTEQKFALASFEMPVRQMSHEQARELLIKLYKEMVTRDAMYRDLLKTNWGIG